MRKRFERSSIAGNSLFVVLSPYHSLLVGGLAELGDSILVVGKGTEESIVTETVTSKYFRELHHSIPNSEYLFTHPLSTHRVLKNVDGFVKRCGASNVVLFNDDEPISQFVSCNYFGVEKTMLVEEGIGLYRDNRHRMKIVKKIVGKPLFGKQYRCLERIGTSGYVGEIVCRYPHLIECRDKRPKLVEDDFEFLSEEITQDFGEYASKGTHHWFIGQPLPEDEVLSVGQYVDVVVRCARIAEEAGEVLTIKPHPREDLSKYNDLVSEGRAILEDTRGIPFEIICPNSPICSIYTISSSAAVFAAAYTQSNVYCLARIVGDDDFPEELFTNAGVHIMDRWFTEDAQCLRQKVANRCDTNA